MLKLCPPLPFNFIPVKYMEWVGNSFHAEIMPLLSSSTLHQSSTMNESEITLMLKSCPSSPLQCYTGQVRYVEWVWNNFDAETMPLLSPSTLHQSSTWNQWEITLMLKSDVNSPSSSQIRSITRSIQEYNHFWGTGERDLLQSCLVSQSIFLQSQKYQIMVDVELWKTGERVSSILIG